MNFDLSAQLKEELRRFGGLEDGVHGFINYNFAKRLRKKGVKIKTAVDWFENHGRDRGWNYGFQKFHPETQTLGYNMVFLSRWHLATSPLSIEREKKVLPSVILTPSRYLINSIKKNDPKLNVKQTGSFRFPSPTRNTPTTGPLRILVPLSYKPDATWNSINKVRDLFKSLQNSSKLGFQIRFKPHPSTPVKNLMIQKDKSLCRYEDWSYSNLSDELQTTDIVLGEWTFALMESLNAGIPTGVIRSSDGLFHSSIPPVFLETMNVNIESERSFMKLVKFALQRRSERSNLKHSLLEKPSRNLALEVFGL